MKTRRKKEIMKTPKIFILFLLLMLPFGAMLRAEWLDGEVQKIDAKAKTITISEIDPITGVSANIMTGQPIRGGTAFSDILMDEAALLRLQKGLPAIPAAEDEEEDAPTQEDVDAELYENTTDLCSPARLRMNMTLPNAGAVNEDEEDVEMVVLE